MHKEVVTPMYAPTAAASPPMRVAPLAADWVAALGAEPLSDGLPSSSAGIAAATSLAIRSSTLDVLEGQLASVSGTLATGHPLAGLAGQVVDLQALAGKSWRTVAVAHTAGTGIFRLRYLPRRVGSERVRVLFAGQQGLLGTRDGIGRLNVYRQVQASWYGGGGALACGGSLTSSTMGVASRTLPCGTLVTLRFAGRSVRVPVVDRGPYVSGRELDLTEATKQALGFGGTGVVWSTA